MAVVRGGGLLPFLEQVPGGAGEEVAEDPGGEHQYGGAEAPELELRSLPRPPCSFVVRQLVDEGGDGAGPHEDKEGFPADLQVILQEKGKGIGACTDEKDCQFSPGESKENRLTPADGPDLPPAHLEPVDEGACSGTEVALCRLLYPFQPL
jgi:hypothetical protein